MTLIAGMLTGYLLLGLLVELKLGLLLMAVFLPLYFFPLAISTILFNVL